MKVKKIILSIFTLSLLLFLICTQSLASSSIAKVELDLTNLVNLTKSGILSGYAGYDWYGWIYEYENNVISFASQVNDLNESKQSGSDSKSLSKMAYFVYNGVAPGIVSISFPYKMSYNISASGVTPYPDWPPWYVPEAAASTWVNVSSYPVAVGDRYYETVRRSSISSNSCATELLFERMVKPGQVIALTFEVGSHARAWGYDPSPNIAPTVEAGPNILINSDQQNNTIIQGNASDPNGDALQYQWLEGTDVLQTWRNVGSNGETFLYLNGLSVLSPGPHNFILEVSDGKASSRDEMILTMGNSAPHASATGGGIYQIRDSVWIGGQVSDFDGDLLLYTWSDGDRVLFNGTIQTSYGGSPISLPYYGIHNLDLGVHTLTLQVSDEINPPVSANINIEIIDNLAPTLAPASDKTILWPLNRQLVPITIFANASDNSGLPVKLKATVASNEPHGGIENGYLLEDWTEPVINNGIITLYLRSERSGAGNGRTYTITIIGTDEAGNSSTAEVKIIVPHDKGK